ncbi:hypothetical protein J3D55_000312 [Chryseobacterium ginsenosidimutans]|uniref:hypothetical protein n=1 Tax=Chryseobacterium ginsenosidimutans TaxID=687846 RepID=UPI00216A68EA|nr:hypothetical protein [Chryseobacterium ginsenosidimutans]MCS3867396.1 hypothetical protein [Chryseobacterium ginsenosidimutans]
MAVVAPDFLVFLVAEVLVAAALSDFFDSSFFGTVSLEFFPVMIFSFTSAFFVSSCGSGFITVFVSGTAASAGSGVTSATAARLPG